MRLKSERMERFVPQFFAELNEKVAALRASGADIISLDVGSPDLPPADFIVETLAHVAAEADVHGYQSHRGFPELRQAWATLYQREYQVDLLPELHVLPVLGSKEGIFNLLMATVNPGDVVLIPDPGYITYTQGTLFAGGEPYYMPLKAENQFLPDLEAVPEEILRRAKVLWLNYPNNPTAAIASQEFFERAINFGREHGTLVCHDAAYGQITFEGYRAPSLMNAPGAKEVAVEFNTLSKTYNMAGWRVGAAIGSPQVLKDLFTLKTHVDSGHFLPIWKAAVAAMTGDQAWVQGRNEIYRQRRDVLVEGLERIGLEAIKPRASFYVWTRIPPGYSSMEFASQLLEQANVSVTPGTVFGACGEGYVRITLTAPVERIAQALDRIEVWMKS